MHITGIFWVCDDAFPCWKEALTRWRGLNLQQLKTTSHQPEIATQ